MTLIPPPPAAFPKPVPAVGSPGGAERRSRAGGGSSESREPFTGEESPSPQTAGGPRAQPQPRTQEGQLQPTVSSGSAEVKVFSESHLGLKSDVSDHQDIQVHADQHPPDAGSPQQGQASPGPPPPPIQRFTGGSF